MEGGEIDLPAGLRVDAVHAPVFVSTLVLKEQDMLAIVRPEVLTDAALAIVGDRLRVGQLAGGREPDVQHAVGGREKGDEFSVRTEPRLRLHRVAEQRCALNQRDTRCGSWAWGCWGCHYGTSTFRERGEHERESKSNNGLQYSNPSLRSSIQAASSGTAMESRSPGVALGSSTQRRNRSLPLMTSMASRSFSYSYGKSRQSS